MLLLPIPGRALSCVVRAEIAMLRQAGDHPAQPTATSQVDPGSDSIITVHHFTCNSQPVLGQIVTFNVTLVT